MKSALSALVVLFTLVSESVQGRSLAFGWPRATAKFMKVSPESIGNPAVGGGRPSDKILGELDALRIPVFEPNKKNDQSYVSAFLKTLKQATEQRNALILEFYEAAPNHDRVPALMSERWSIRPYAPASEKILSETNDIEAHTRNTRLKAEATYARTYTTLYDSPRDKPLDLRAVDAYIKLFPHDPRGAILLSLATKRTRDPQLKTTLEDRIVKQFPLTMSARKILGIRQQNERIGKPFELEFTDAVGGSAVSIKTLKGKLVVIDFWATWCGPCVADMPRMKALYQKYRGKGVDFIGVSLDLPEDEGGLKCLRDYVAKNEIRWPQYYQGEGWDSRFSSACGIHEIPTVFLLDTDGKLNSTNAGNNLDEMISELLDKTAKDRDRAKSAGK
jgi:thiol-disulfide isomerase/thioredoxin